MFAIKIREDLKEFEKVASSKNQVNELRVQDNLGEQNYHQNIEKLFEPVTNTNKNTSENLTETIKETSCENNKAIGNLNHDFLETRNDRGMMASYLLSPSSRITNPENTSQFK